MTLAQRIMQHAHGRVRAGYGGVGAPLSLCPYSPLVVFRPSGSEIGIMCQSWNYATEISKAKQRSEKWQTAFESLGEGLPKVFYSFFSLRSKMTSLEVTKGQISL